MLALAFAPDRHGFRRCSAPATARAGGCAGAGLATVALLALSLSACDALPLIDLRGRGQLQGDAGTGGTSDAGLLTCGDRVRDAEETAVDCGGPACGACGDGLGCLQDTDCQSANCWRAPGTLPEDEGACISCRDSRKNGWESDVDCGGLVCAGCALGQNCLVDSDCQSGHCSYGVGCVGADAPVLLRRPLLIPVSYAARGLALGHFDGDRLLDAAVVDGARGGLALLFGNGDGTLGRTQHIAIGPDLHGASAGDFDGDGVDDVVVGSGSGNSIHLYGSALGQQSLRSAAPPRSVVLGDFDGDHLLDLAVASIDATSVGLYQGDGKGGFALAKDPTPLMAAGELVAVADLDGDGRSDLVVNGVFGPTQVLLGAKGLSLPLAFSYVFPDGGLGGLGQRFAYTAPAIGHFNGDRLLDLATSNAAGILQPLLADGMGGYAATTAWAATRAHPMSIAVADFDRDGFDDMAVGCDSDKVIELFLNNGKGGFGALAQITAPGPVATVLSGDFNGDGKPDIAALAAAGTLMIVMQK